MDFAATEAAAGTGADLGSVDLRVVDEARAVPLPPVAAAVEFLFEAFPAVAGALRGDVRSGAGCEGAASDGADETAADNALPLP